MIPEKLKEIRESKNMNKKEFANFLGLKYTTYNNYETGTREPASDFLIQISETFDVSIDYLLGLKDNKEILHSYELKSEEYLHIKKYRRLDDTGKKTIDNVLDTMLNYKERHSIKDIPQETEHAFLFQENRMYMTQYDYGVSAGIGNYLDEWDVPKTTVEIEDTPLAHKADYILKVDGDSMMPKFKNSDRVFVKSQNTVEMNEMGIFIIDGKCFLKQYKGDHLHSLNPEYEDIAFSENQNIKCVGKVLGKV